MMQRRIDESCAWEGPWDVQLSAIHRLHFQWNISQFKPMKTLLSTKHPWTDFLVQPSQRKLLREYAVAGSSVRPSLPIREYPRGPAEIVSSQIPPHNYFRWDFRLQTKWWITRTSQFTAKLKTRKIYILVIIENSQMYKTYDVIKNN